MEISKYKDTISTLVGLVSLVGIPVTIVLFFREKRRERIDRENGTYLEVHGRYLEYLKLCLQYPEIRVWENEMEVIGDVIDKVSIEKQRRESIVFTYFISMSEQAFLVYRDATDNQRKRQWKGWEDYIIEYMRRDSFWNAWSLLGYQFDTEFEEFMRRCARKAGRDIPIKQVS